MHNSTPRLEPSWVPVGSSQNRSGRIDLHGQADLGVDRAAGKGGTCICIATDLIALTHHPPSATEICAPHRRGLQLQSLWRIPTAAVSPPPFMAVQYPRGFKHVQHPMIRSDQRDLREGPQPPAASTWHDAGRRRAGSVAASRTGGEGLTAAVGILHGDCSDHKGGRRL